LSRIFNSKFFEIILCRERETEREREIYFPYLSKLIQQYQLNNLILGIYYIRSLL
jgi:hypothetical protein